MSQTVLSPTIHDDLKSTAEEPSDSHLARLSQPSRRHERGQATAEYALVMLAAAALAGLLIAWAATTGGIGQLFDAVMSSLVGRVT